MTYQYKREPLSVEEADRLLNAAQSFQEKICVWGLMETGFRVSELAEVMRNHFDEQTSGKVSQIQVKIEGERIGNKAPQLLRDYKLKT